MIEKLWRSGLLMVLAVICFSSPLSAHASEHSLLKELGLKSGELYASAKTKLLKAGWKVDMAHVDEMNLLKSPPYGFREVVCGNGWDASCSARFLREGQEIMLSLRPKKTLVIDEAWDDK